MPKVSNTIIYPQDDNLSMDDYTIGTNSNTGNKKTQTYAFKSIFSLFYNFLGYNAFFNTTDTTTYPIGTPGCFYVFDESNALTADFSEARKITFSAYDTYNFNTANYFNIIVNSEKFLFKLINLEDKNNFVFLKPSNFVLSGTGTTFDVDVLAEAGLSNGNFVNYKRYLLVLEFAAGTFNPADYDLTDFTNTSGDPFVTAQDLTDALALLPAPITKTSELINDGENGNPFVDTNDLGATAFSNDYNDLNNLPIIPTPIVNHSELNLNDGSNPHGTTKSDVGLGNVDNTSDLSKPISTDTQNALNLKQDNLISEINIKTINGESVLGSGNLDVYSPNTQIFHWWGGNWSTTTLNLYYYIGFNGAAIETAPGSAGTTVTASMTGRNKGLFIAPFDCKIKRVLFKDGGSGSYTGKFALASGLPNYGGTWNIGYTNTVTHLDNAISSVGYNQNKFEYLVTDNITVPKGYVISPMLIFSAQAQAGKVGIEISIEIEEVI